MSRGLLPGCGEQCVLIVLQNVIFKVTLRAKEGRQNYCDGQSVPRMSHFESFTRMK